MSKVTLPDVMSGYNSVSRDLADGIRFGGILFETLCIKCYRFAPTSQHVDESYVR